MLATFRLSGEQIDAIRQTLQSEPKTEPTFVVEVKDETGDVVAEVQKVVSVRKK